MECPDVQKKFFWIIKTKSYIICKDWVIHINESSGDFPGGPVLKTPCFQCRGVGTPGWGTKILHASWHNPPPQKGSIYKMFRRNIKQKYTSNEQLYLKLGIHQIKYRQDIQEENYKSMLKKNQRVK